MNKRALPFFALMLLTSPLLAAEPPVDSSEARAAEAAALLESANELLHQDLLAAREKYLEAAGLFEHLLTEDKIENGPLYLNLGNAYYLAGDLGRAILNYRRAERFLPGDLTLRRNLIEARRERRDTIANDATPPLFKTLLFWHYDFTIPVRAGAFIFAYLVLWAFALTYLYHPRHELRWAIGTAAACAMLMAGSVLTEAAVKSRTTEGVVLAPQVTVREGDSNLSAAAFPVPLHAGTEFVLLESRGGWRHIQLADGRAGWVPNTTVALLDMP